MSGCVAASCGGAASLDPPTPGKAMCLPGENVQLDSAVQWGVDLADMCCREASTSVNNAVPVSVPNMTDSSS